MNITSAFDPKKTTIVFVLPSLTAGGAERALITLMNNIDRTYFDPAFIAISDDGPMRHIIDPSIPVHNLKSKRVSLSLPKLYFKLKALKPDIIVSTMAHMNLTLMLLKPFFPQTRFIIREAITPSFSLNEHPFFAPILKLAYRTLYPAAHRVISPAQIIIDEFQTLLKMPCKNHRLLYNFVDTDRIRAGENEPFKLTENRKNTVRFVAAGRLHPQKGFGRLLLALSSFETHYDWQLTIFGEGPRREYLQELIQKYNLSDRIHLPGLSDNPWPYFAAADCFLLPSRWEGLPNVALESLACGTPVIASEEAGGIHEIAKLAPPGSIILSKTMDDFIKAMQAVRPSAHAEFRDSLLPSAFQKETVIRCFESILKED
jgi:glycosyltransferase involved in cell wall biosynthesis